MAKNNSSSEGAKIGVDLGTANTLVYVSGYGVIFDEPTVVAYDKETGQVIECGERAKSMIGKAHEKIKIVQPMRAGVIADIKATEALLQFIFGKLGKFNFDIKKSTMLIVCPARITGVESKALIDVASKFGISDVLIEPEIKAGALGCGIDIYKTEGTMVVDIGAGSTNVGVLSCGDVVCLDSINIAGNWIDAEITKFMKVHHNLVIGEKTAERIKLELATLNPANLDRETEATGRNLSAGTPDSVVVKQNEIYQIVLRAFETIKHTIAKVLEDTPPELSSDIISTGIYAIGGGAHIDGVKEYLENLLGLPVCISGNVSTAIVQGAKQLLKNRGNYLVRPEE